MRRWGDKVVLRFVVYHNGIALFNPDLRMLQWFNGTDRATWEDVMYVIESLLTRTVIKITVVDSIYLPR